MDYIYWIFIGIVVVAVLFTIKDWIRFVLTSLASDGLRFTLFIIGLTVLFIAPSIVKIYAPSYYGLSIWALILYFVAFLIYRNFITHNEEKEG